MRISANKHFRLNDVRHEFLKVTGARSEFEYSARALWNSRADEAIPFIVNFAKEFLVANDLTPQFGGFRIIQVHPLSEGVCEERSQAVNRVHRFGREGRFFSRAAAARLRCTS